MHTITLTQNDRLMFQLYEALTDPVKIKSRKKSFFILIAISLFMTGFGYLENDTFSLYYGLVTLFLILCFGRMYLGWRHKRHYSKHVKNNSHGHPEETVQIEISDDKMRVVDRVSDSSIKISEIILASEIKDYYFLKLSTGTKMIIPKTLPVLNNEINSMIRNHNIPHVVQLEWKWR